jgi:hypothetical protein
MGDSCLANCVCRLSGHFYIADVLLESVLEFCHPLHTLQCEHCMCFWRVHLKVGIASSLLSKPEVAKRLMWLLGWYRDLGANGWHRKHLCLEELLKIDLEAECGSLGVQDGLPAGRPYMVGLGWGRRAIYHLVLNGKWYKKAEVARLSCGLTNRMDMTTNCL